MNSLEFKEIINMLFLARFQVFWSYYETKKFRSGSSLDELGEPSMF